MPERPLLVIGGPTASGKTSLALELAERLPIEVISADSRQVYRGLDVGTAKPTPAERRRAPHHVLDIIDPRRALQRAPVFRVGARRDCRHRGRGGPSRSSSAAPASTSRRCSQPPRSAPRRPTPNTQPPHPRPRNRRIPTPPARNQPVHPGLHPRPAGRTRDIGQAHRPTHRAHGSQYPPRRRGTVGDQACTPVGSASPRS